MEGFHRGVPKIKNLEQQENKIEQPKIKEGVDFVFEQNPAIAEVGTKEQYSQYLDTIFPESKIKDIVYHQTLSREFNVKDWKLSRLGGAYFNFYNSERTDSQFTKMLSKYVMDFGRKNRTVIGVVDARNPFIINRKNAKEIEKKIGMSTQDTGKLRKNFDLSENDSILGYANPLYDRGELDDLVNHNIPLNKKSGIELALFDPANQIHDLGSKEDIQNFKQFVESKE